MIWTSIAFALAIAYAPQAGFRVLRPRVADATRLYRLDATLGAAVPQHAGTVNAVAVSPDLRFVVSSAGGHDVVVWNVADGSRRFDLVGHRGEVFAIEISEDGRAVFTCDQYGACVLWDLEAGEVVRVMKLARRDDDGPERCHVTAAALTPDAQRGVVGLANGEIVRLDLERGTEIDRTRVAEPALLSRDAPIVDVAYCEGGARIVAAAGSVLAHVDASNGSVVARTKLPIASTRFLAVSPSSGRGFAHEMQRDGRPSQLGELPPAALLVVDAKDGVVTRVDADPRVVGAAFCADGTVAATFTHDAAELRDADTLERIGDAWEPRVAGAPLNAIALHGDGNTLVAGPALGGDVPMCIDLVDVRRGARRWNSSGLSRAAATLAFAADGTRLVAVDRDSHGVSFDVVQRGILGSSRVFTGAVALAFDTSGDRVFALGLTQSSTLDPRTMKLAQTFACRGGPWAWDRAGALVVLPQLGGKPQRIDAETLVVSDLAHDAWSGRPLDLSPDAALALLQDGASLVVRSLADDSARSLAYADTVLHGAVFDADATHVVEIGRGGLRRDTIERDALVAGPIVPSALPLLRGVAQSADRRRLAVVARASGVAVAVIVFDVETCVEIDRIAVDGGGIGALAFATDGTLAIGTANGPVQIWRPR